RRARRRASRRWRGGPNRDRARAATCSDDNGRSARQAVARQALGGAGGGVVGVGAQGAARLVQGLLGAAEGQQGEGAVRVRAGRVDAGVGVGGGRRVAEPEGGVA